MTLNRNLVDWVEFAERRWWNPDELLPPIVLSEHVSEILEVLHAAESQGDKARVLQEIDRVRAKYITMERFDAGVAQHDCGLAALRLGDTKTARELFYDARNNLSRGDSHHYAVATWMLGCVYWLENSGQHNKGIDAWQEAIEIFERQAFYASSSMFKMQWYRMAWDVMVSVLKLAIQEDSPPSVEDVTGEELGDSGPAYSADFEDPEEEDPAGVEFPIPIENYFELFAVYDEIPAGLPVVIDHKPTARHPVHPDLEPIDHLEVTQVRVGKQDYLVQSLRRGERKINLLQESEHYIMRVKGNSMNQAGIDDGDLVLMRAQNYATHTDIAGLTFVKHEDHDEDDRPATLKRYLEQGDLIVIRAESDDPEFTDWEHSYFKSELKEEEKLVVYGVAVAVLKPI